MNNGLVFCLNNVNLFPKPKARLYFCILSHKKTTLSLKFCKLCSYPLQKPTVSHQYNSKRKNEIDSRWDDATTTTPRLTPGVIPNDIKERKESRMQLITWRQQFWKWFRITRVEIGIGSPLRNCTGWRPHCSVTQGNLHDEDCSALVTILSNSDVLPIKRVTENEFNKSVLFYNGNSLVCT